MAPTPEQLGNYVARHREALGLSMRQLAVKVGVHHRTIDKIERGEITAPAPLILQRLARALGVDYEDLLALSNYLMPDGLPGYQVYLRTKYPDLPDEEVERMEHDFRIKLEHYEREQEGDHGSVTPD